MGSSHLSQENRSGMVGLMWSLLWLWGLWLAPLGSQAAAPESGLLEPQTTHIPLSNPQVMREPNCCLLPALTPDPQCATDGTLPENLGESGRIWEAGKELWRAQEIQTVFFKELREPQAREQRTLTITGF